MSDAAELVELDINKDSDSDTSQFLTFILGSEEYGVDILQVQEIKGWDRVTPIPNTPDYIKGVINLRGAIVPIIDLRQRFNLESISYDATTVVIVLKVPAEDKERTIGIVVDAVSDVYNISASDMKPPPDFGDIDIDFVKGLATVSGKMVIILNIDRLLNESIMPDMDSRSE